jgi:uncharacterized radical SAM superfamily Fe-S cluster-containing enzyme
MSCIPYNQKLKVDDMQTTLLLWVTSKCNLKCPLCSVKYIQKLLPDYEMSIEEVKEIIRSSKERNIHYGMIHYGGGEPTVWKHLKEATQLFYESGITDHITLISNGTNPDKIFDISHMLPCYAISSTQCSKDQLNTFKNSGHKILYNNTEHVNLITKPQSNTLPALCCNACDYLSKETNQVHYINGKIYYCCYALVISEIVGLTLDLFCDFKDDFISKFADKIYDKNICQYCLCNSKVDWEVGR